MEVNLKYDIVFICLGNICRSSSAEYLMKFKYPQLKIGSFGIGRFAKNGKKSPKFILDELENRIGYRPDHSSKGIPNELDSKLVVCFVESHASKLKERFPNLNIKTFIECASYNPFKSRSVPDPNFHKSRTREILDFIQSELPNLLNHLQRPELEQW